tara:strand:- start:124680 stop:125138 length:459 start_codon:yes stop_codon:yes gene_type:complete
LNSTYSAKNSHPEHHNDPPALGKVNFGGSIGHISETTIKKKIGVQGKIMISFDNVEIIDPRDNVTKSDAISSVKFGLNFFSNFPVFGNFMLGVSANNFSQKINEREFILGICYSVGLGFRFGPFDLLTSLENSDLGPTGKLRFFSTSLILNF